MNINGRQHFCGYDYQICTYVNSTGAYQGVILVTALNGVRFNPIIEIRTATSFYTKMAARIEADALAVDLMHTGAISKLISQAD